MLSFIFHQDFPEDITGKFDELKTFVRSNSELGQWIGALIIASEVRMMFFYQSLYLKEKKNPSTSKIEFARALLFAPHEDT